MPEKTEKTEKKMTKEEIAKLIEEIAKGTQQQPGIDKELLKVALTPKEGEDPFVTIFKIQMFRDMLDKTKKGEEIDLNKLLTFMAIKTAMQPQPPSIDPNVLLALTKGGGDSQFMQAYLQQAAQNQQMQQQFNQQLLMTLFGQKMQQQEQQMQTLQESLKEALEEVNERIATLQLQAQGGQNPDLLKQLEYEIKKKEMLEKFAETFKPKEIISESGKINWGKVLDRIVDIGEKVVEKLPAKTPELKPIQTIPIQEIQAQPTQPIEIQPQTEVQAQPQQTVQTQPTQAQTTEPKLPEISDIVEEIKKEEKKQ